MKFRTRILTVLVALCCGACTSPRRAEVPSPEPGGSMEAHLTSAKQALKSKDYERSLEEVDAALDSYDNSHIFDRVELLTTGVTLISDLYRTHAKSREYVDALLQGFQAKPTCGGPLLAEFYLRLIAGTGEAGRVVAALDSLGTWTGCSSRERARLLSEFRELLLENGGERIVARHEADLAELIREYLQSRDEYEQNAKEHLGFLLEALVAGGKRDEAIALAERWLCEGLRGMDTDLVLKLFEKYEVEAPEDLSCSASSPPMTSSAAGEGKDDEKTNEDGESDAGDER